MILCFCGLIMAQETDKKEFKMALGESIVWKPFDNCDNIGYDVNGPKIINFKTVKLGECIEVTAKSVGKSSIVATCNDNSTVAVASFVVFDPNEAPVVVEKPVKPATQTFTGIYKFNPPTDNYFITINDMDPIERDMDLFLFFFFGLHHLRLNIILFDLLLNYLIY